MSTRTRWTVRGALIGVLPGALGILLTSIFAGCPDSPGQPGMVCYDIQRFLFRVSGTAAVFGLVLGALIGMSLGRRRAP